MLYREIVAVFSLDLYKTHKETVWDLMVRKIAAGL
jgi:hypothetical protein